MSTTAKNLAKEAPTSARKRIGGYVILGRMADKGRAAIAGSLGDYHFDCPLDNMLFGFKGVKGEDVKQQLADGVSTDDIAAWINSHGTPKTADEVKAWSDSMEAYQPGKDPEKKEWFTGECKPLGLDPEKATLFDFLDTDDKVSFKN